MNWDELGASTGQYGSVLISTGGAVAPSEGYEFFRIDALASGATISALTGNMNTSAGFPTLAANGSIMGRFTSITLSAGSAIAYLKPVQAPIA